MSEDSIDHVGRGMFEDDAADGQSLVGGHKSASDQMLERSDHSSKKVLDQHVNILTFLGNVIEQIDEEKLLKVSAIKSAGKSVKNWATSILAHKVAVDKILGSTSQLKRSSEDFANQ